MFRHAFLSIVVLSFGFTALATAQAETTDQRLDKLERMMESRQDLDLAFEIQELRDEIQRLHGQLEVTDHQLSQLEQRQRDFYDDLNQRMNNLGQAEPVSAPVAEASPAAASSAVPVREATSAVDTSQAVAAVEGAESDLAAYQAAYQLMADKHYSEAAAAFNAYLAKYPQGDYVANVDYWLGETYLIQHDYANAEAAFNRVITEHAGHQKSADAMLKLGYVYDAAGDPDKALTTLAQVQEDYPGTAVARLAASKTTQIRQQQI